MSSAAFRRSGTTPRISILFFASLLIVIGLACLAVKIRPDSKWNPNHHTLVRVYCASGVAKPIEEMIVAYNKQYSANIEIVRTGGSGQLAGQIKTEIASGILGGADLYITADDTLLDNAFADGTIAERFNLAKQQPVIAVAANSPLRITDLRDLIEQPIRFGIASERAAVGKAVRSIARREGLDQELESKKIIDSENVMTLAQALVAGSLEAAVIWDTTVAQINQTSSPDQPLLKIAAFADSSRTTHSNIAIGVVSTTDVPTEAIKFSRYITSPEQGRATLQRYGFSFIAGDSWEEHPEIHLYFGSMFTPVLEEAVREFGLREGVNIYSRWEGCGKLVAAMRSIKDPDLFPDAFLACDISFLDDVQSLFRSPISVSSNDIVIAVRNKVTSPIKTPADLLDRDLRIGICDPDQSALGRLTKQILSQSPYEGLYQRIQKTSAVTVDVGPTLISQLAAGGLDVAFVYRSNIMANENALAELRIIEFDQRSQNAMATQPWAVSKSTGNAVLMSRLYDWINRPEIIAQFKELGFRMINE